MPRFSWRWWVFAWFTPTGDRVLYYEPRIGQWEWDRYDYRRVFWRLWKIKKGCTCD